MTVRDAYRILKIPTKVICVSGPFDRVCCLFVECDIKALTLALYMLYVGLNRPSIRT